MKPIPEMRVGIPLVGNAGWLGGVNYVIHLVKAVAGLPASIRPRISLVVARSLQDEAAIGLHAEILPLADKVLFHLDPPPAAQAGGHGRFGYYRDTASLYEQIDFFFPCLCDAVAGYPAASWIPDFQHKHLPHLFPAEEIAKREAAYAKVAAVARLAVFSSRAAEADFRTFYPESAAESRVLRFCAAVEPAWFEADPAEAAARYGLAEGFLLCSNQFWAHKDHPTLLRALAELKRSGIRLPLVCTGPTVDHRVGDAYFSRLQAMIGTLKLTGEVHILGLIPRQDQIQLMRQALAVVQPSLFEGWSTVVEDGRALGKTIFHSAIPVHLEQAPDHGVPFRPGDPTDLAARIREHLDDLVPTAATQREVKARMSTAERQRVFGLEFVQLVRAAQDIFASPPEAA